MNKLQWLAMIFTFIGVLIIIIFGFEKSYTDVINIIGYIIIGIGIIIFFILGFRTRKCPKCGTKLPKIVKNKEDQRDSPYGGWICPGCGAVLNSSAKLIKE